MEVSNQEVRVNDSRTRETNFPTVHRDNNIFSVDYSYWWAMQSGLVRREINLPPLAHRYVYGQGRNSNLQRLTTRGLFTSAPSYARPIYVTSTPRAVIPYYQRYYALGHGISVNNGISGNRASESNFMHSASLLSPFALEWNHISIEERSLFFTFSRGEPLTEQQIFWYLAMWFGIRNVLEVDINKPRQGPPHFGRLLFSTATIPMIIMNGRSETRITINGKSMICKKYMPKEHPDND